MDAAGRERSDHKLKLKYFVKACILNLMCPNCVLNQAGAWIWLGPGLICVAFMVLAGYFLYQAKQEGVFEGDEEEPKHVIFED